MKKLLIMILMLALVLMLVVGCSSPTSEDPAPTTQKASPVTATQAPTTQAPTASNVFDKNSAEHNDTYNELIIMHTDLMTGALENMNNAFNYWEDSSDDPLLERVCWSMIDIADAWLIIDSKEVPDKYYEFHKSYTGAIKNVKTASELIIKSIEASTTDKRIALVEKALEYYGDGMDMILEATDLLDKIDI